MQISEMLSYDSVQYFSFQFKKAIGITPAQFRNEVKTDNAYLKINFQKTGEHNDDNPDEN